jgi:transposase
MQWSPAPQKREQMVLFSRRLDDAIEPDHQVRLLDAILGRIDWQPWEARYHGRLGQPPIPPRVLAGTILYGLLSRIRSSRRLEEALSVRLDFMWLAEGRVIDHTTLSEFRRQHAGELKNLFVQIGLLARELGWLPLQQLAYDGTRLRANSRRGCSRTPQELLTAKEELAKKFAEMEAQAAAEDTRDDESFGGGGSHKLAAELADVQRRQELIDNALAELDRVQAADETVPSRIPLTDPESRVTPNKEGGFAPNYTPLATVDAASGLIVAADVIAMTNEDAHLTQQIKTVQEDFGLAAPPPEMLADGAMCSGETLVALDALGVTLYSPVPLPDPANPALRADLTQPVPPEDWDRLPTKVQTRSGKKQSQLQKEAFVYDEQHDCYWCPQGQKLPALHKTSETRGSRRLERTRYKAEASTCAGCPLRERCLQPGAKRREISRDQHAARRERHARHMAQAESQTKYKKRREVAEMPFAVIKHHFGARRLLLRGLDQVRTEWRWLATAFNLHKLMSLLKARAGPAAALSLSTLTPV